MQFEHASKLDEKFKAAAAAVAGPSAGTSNACRDEGCDRDGDKAGYAVHRADVMPTADYRADMAVGKTPGKRRQGDGPKGARHKRIRSTVNTNGAGPAPGQNKADKPRGRLGSSDTGQGSSSSSRRPEDADSSSKLGRDKERANTRNTTAASSSSNTGSRPPGLQSPVGIASTPGLRRAMGFTWRQKRRGTKTGIRCSRPQANRNMGPQAVQLDSAGKERDNLNARADGNDYAESEAPSGDRKAACEPGDAFT